MTANVGAKPKTTGRAEVGNRVTAGSRGLSALSDGLGPLLEK